MCQELTGICGFRFGDRDAFAETLDCGTFMASVEGRAVYRVVIRDGNKIEWFGLESGNSADGRGNGKKCRSERCCELHLELELLYIEECVVVRRMIK